MPKCVIASAPAKVILFGEHSVVYGAPAIAAAIPGRTYATIRGASERTIKFTFENTNESFLFPLPLQELKSTTKLEKCAYLVCKNFEKSLKEGMEVSVEARQLPIGAGLGSSASFSVALSAAFHIYTLQIEGMKEGKFYPTIELITEIKSLADECEKIFHGNPSGIDTSVCLLGGIIKFQRGADVEKIGDSLPLKIAVVDSLVPRETATLVQKVRDLKQHYSSVIDPIIESMKGVVETVTEEIRSPSGGRKIIELARINHGLLYSLGVSHPVLERINLTVADSGVGFKLTGAGGGGNSLIFIPQDVDENNIVEKLKTAGFGKTLLIPSVEPGLDILLL